VSAVRNSLWGLVLLAAIATGFAGIRALTQTSPPLPNLGNLGDAVPSKVAGRVWIAHVLEGYCDRCHDLRRSGYELEKQLAPEVTVESVDLSNPPKLSSEAGGRSIVAEDAADLADRIHALAGSPPVLPGELLLKNQGDVGEWSLTNADGRPFGDKDLKGKIWIAAFVFTRCAGPCPDMCKGMQELVKKLPDDPRLRFVSFSVDPDYDTPTVMKEFSKYWEAPERWKFLTGTGVWNLAYNGFKLVAKPAEEPRPGSQIIHSTRFTLVDGTGQMRGLYTYDFENRETIGPTLASIVRDARAMLETPEKVVDHVHDSRSFLVDREGMLRGVYAATEKESLVRDARRLARSPEKLFSIRTLPRLNAILNGASFLFLSFGFGFILKKRIGLHKACMTTAFFTSILFLASYLTYHVQAGSVKYTGEGWMRTAYFAVLLSHTVLAILVAPLSVVTARLAWHEKFDRHRTIARWTLPLWMYVSLTGILVYLVLYQMN